jgi:uncharacterized membrane protein YfcA
MPSLKIPNSCFFFVGLISGILSLLIGSTGPFQAAFFVRDDIVKNEIIATKASMQLFSHLLKIPSFLFLGFNYMAHWDLILIGIVATIIGTRYGVSILERFSERIFSIIFRTALFLSMLRLSYQVLKEVL